MYAQTSALMIFLLLIFITCNAHTLIDFSLITSPQMPYDGQKIAVYFNETAKDIWLLSPAQVFNGSNTATNFTFTYNINNHSFAIQSSTPQPFSGPSTAVKDTIYFNRWGSGDIGSYQIHNKEWIMPITPSLPIKVRSACLTTDDAFIYVIGGQNGESSPSFQAYNIQTGFWLNNLPLMQLSTVNSACEAHNGYIYVFGGYYYSSEGIYSDSIEALFVGDYEEIVSNLSNKSWTLLSSTMSIGRTGLSSVICGEVDVELIYLIGGFDGNHYLDLVEIFNTTNKQITTLAVTLKQKRRIPTVICIDEYIYVFGGSWKGNNDTEDRYTVNNWEISNPLYTASPTLDTEPSYYPSYLPSVLPTSSPHTHEPSYNPSTMPSYSPSVVATSRTYEPSYYPSITPIESTAIIAIPSTIATDIQSDFSGQVVDDTSTTAQQHSNTTQSSPQTKSSTMVVVICVVISVFVFIAILFVYIVWKRKVRTREINQVIMNLKEMKETVSSNADKDKYINDKTTTDGRIDAIKDNAINITKGNDDDSEKQNQRTPDVIIDDYTPSKGTNDMMKDDEFVIDEAGITSENDTYNVEGERDNNDMDEHQGEGVCTKGAF